MIERSQKLSQRNDDRVRNRGSNLGSGQCPGPEYPTWNPRAVLSVRVDVGVYYNNPQCQRLFYFVQVWLGFVLSVT